MRSNLAALAVPGVVLRVLPDQSVLQHLATFRKGTNFAGDRFTFGPHRSW